MEISCHICRVACGCINYKCMASKWCWMCHQAPLLQKLTLSQLFRHAQPQPKQTTCITMNGKTCIFCHNAGSNLNPLTAMTCCVLFFSPLGPPARLDTWGMVKSSIQPWILKVEIVMSFQMIPDQQSRSWHPYLIMMCLFRKRFTLNVCDKCIPSTVLKELKGSWYCIHSCSAFRLFPPLTHLYALF